MAVNRSIRKRLLIMITHFTRDAQRCERSYFCHFAGCSRLPAIRLPAIRLPARLVGKSTSCRPVCQSRDQQNATTAVCRRTSWTFAPTKLFFSRKFPQWILLNSRLQAAPSEQPPKCHSKGALTRGLASRSFCNKPKLIHLFKKLLVEEEKENDIFSLLPLEALLIKKQAIDLKLPESLKESGAL